MNNVVEDFVAKARWVLKTAAKRRWLVLAITAAVAIASGLGLTVVPDRYEAAASVYVDTQTVLKPLMADLTFQPDIDQQVGMLARTLISRPNIERLVDLPGLQFDVSSPGAREATVSRLMNRIRVSHAGSGNLYKITYRDPNPERAQHLVEATVDLFVNANAGAKKRDSEEAGLFIEEQIRSHEAKLVEAENRLKEFKVRNFGVSGVSNQDYFSRVSGLTDEVNKLRIELNAAERSRDSYRRELAAEDPQLPAELAAVSGVPAISEGQARLQAQRKQLDDLLRRYTDVHPDVISARRVIGQLEVEERARQEAEARALAKTGKTGKAATSPVYQKLRISLAESEAHVASLRSQLAGLQSQLQEVRSLAGRVPQVEAELAQLNRDYDVIRKNYELMVSRRESASLGVKLDESAQLAEFRLVEPPHVSPSPVFPGRLHLAAIAVVVSLVAGFAVAVIVDLTWPTIDDAASLRAFSGRPVLGTVSMLVTPQGKHRRRMDAWRFNAAFCLLLTLQVLWVAWIALQPHFDRGSS